MICACILYWLVQCGIVEKPLTREQRDMIEKISKEIKDNENGGEK